VQEPEYITMQIKDPEQQKKIRRAVFLVYLAITIKLIIFKYPWEHLREIMDTWEKGVILEGLETANFTLFKTVRMYIRYYDRLNSFENLFGNVGIFVPFGILLPWSDPMYRSWWRVLCNAFLFVTGIEVFQLFSAFGAFDVDDILLNCFGAMLGYLTFWVLERRRAAARTRPGQRKREESLDRGRGGE
jgi:glycopeptide antibiotics resistance protein